jgi:uncharacterized protein (TIGR03000 family)
MIRSRPLALAVVLGCALVVTAPATAHAQHRGGGGDGGGHICGHVGVHGGGHAMPALHSAFRPGPFSLGGNRFFGFGFPSFGFGYPRYGYGFGYGLGYGYIPPYGYPGYGFGFGYPSFGYGYYRPYGIGLGPYGSAFNPFAPSLAPVITTSALWPAPNGAAPEQLGPPAPAKVEVIVPDPLAEVFFDGQKTNRTGTMRVYDTPTLTPGKTYSYQVRAHWTQDGRTIDQQRTVIVSAGATTVVNFKQ